MWKSPNGTIRNILGGVIFREPIVCRNVPRLIPGWTQPIVVGRMRLATNIAPLISRCRARASLPLSLCRGRQRTNRDEKVYDFPGSGVALAMYNLDDSIRDFARASMNYALQRDYPLYLSTRTRSSRLMTAASRIYSRKCSTPSSRRNSRRKG